MTDQPDETPDEIDWAMMRGAVINLAEIVWTYHAALIAAGFDPGAALHLSAEWQNEWMRQTK